MIRYALKCRGCGHGFDGWFRSSADFDTQGARGLLTCPVCDGHGVDKALMSPAVAAAPQEPASPGGAVTSAPSGEAAARTVRTRSAQTAGPGAAAAGTPDVASRARTAAEEVARAGRTRIGIPVRWRGRRRTRREEPDEGLGPGVHPVSIHRGPTSGVQDAPARPSVVATGRNRSG